MALQAKHEEHKQQLKLKQQLIANQASKKTAVDD